MNQLKMEYEAILHKAMYSEYSPGIWLLTMSWLSRNRSIFLDKIPGFSS